jgi:hypothetical protein
MEKNKYQFHPLKNEDSDAAAITTSTNDKYITLVWLDEEALDTTSHNYRVTIDMFQKICGDNYKLYNCDDLFLIEIEILTKTMELIVIMSGKFAEITIPKLTVPLLRELSSIFIFCQDYDNYKHLLKKCRKVNEICIDHDSLEEAIKHEIQPPPDSALRARDLYSVFILKEDLHAFILYQLNIELQKHYQWTRDDREKMINECMEYFRKDNIQKKKIKQFKNEYTPDKAIEWYTRDSFLYRLVNKALRSLYMEEIITFRPYIKDLCKQLEQLHRQNQSDKPLTVFRGYGNMTPRQLDKIKENIGALISFNGFLSTSTNYEVAVMYAGSRSAYQASVIFQIKTNYNLKNVIFADISKLSNIQDEDEVLFSLCSVFRIDSIERDEENQLWRIIMSATDEDTLNLTDYINQRTELRESLEIGGQMDNQMHQLSNDELVTEVRVIKTYNYLLYFTNRCYRHRPIITVCVTIFIIIATVLAGIMGIYIKSKHQISSSHNCQGRNCTTFSTSTGNIHLQLLLLGSIYFYFSFHYDVKNESLQ